MWYTPGGGFVLSPSGSFDRKFGHMRANNVPLRHEIRFSSTENAKKNENLRRNMSHSAKKPEGRFQSQNMRVNYVSKRL